MTRSMTILVLVLLCLFGGVAPARGGDNWPPLCTGLTVASEEVFIGDSVAVTASTSNPDNDPLTFTWTSTCGRIVGEGESVTFEAIGCGDVIVTLTARVSDGHNPPVECSASIALMRRPNECPTVSLTADKTSATPGESVTFTATVDDPDNWPGPITCEWSTSRGSLSRVGDNRVTRDTTDLDGTIEVTATVTDGDPDCVRTTAVSVDVVGE
jgi:chitinase